MQEAEKPKNLRRVSIVDSPIKKGRFFRKRFETPCSLKLDENRAYAAR